MERKVGEKFMQDGEQYVVCRTGLLNQCHLCDLSHPQYGCIGDLEETGDCLSRFRKDRESVHFKKV